MPYSHRRHPSVDRYGNDTPPHVGEPLQTRVDILAEESSNRLQEKSRDVSNPVFKSGVLEMSVP